MIKEATFTSVWDEFSRQRQDVTARCKVNMDTKEVFDIETVNVDSLCLDILSREYITIDGVEHPVSSMDEKDRETEFWYK